MFIIFPFFFLASSDLVVEVNSNSATGGDLAECIASLNLSPLEVLNLSIISGSLRQNDLVDFGNVYSACAYLSVGEQVDVEGKRFPDRMFFNHMSISWVSICTKNASLGDYMFYGCRNLNNLNFPHIVSIGERIFANCDFQSINMFFEFPECEQIGEYAFENASNFRNISLPKLTILPKGAFANSSIIVLDIPSALMLCDYSLAACSSLKEVSFKNVRNITLTTFQDTQLNNLSLPSLVSLPRGITNGYFWGNIETVDFPSLLSIGENVFSLNRNIREIFCNNVREVDQKAFSFCTSLMTVHMEKVLNISMYAFEYCISLTDLYIPNVQYIGECSFMVCISLIEINCTNLKYICNSAFEKCRFLQKFNAPNILYAGRNIIMDCNEIKKLVFKNLVNCSSKMLKNSNPDSIEFSEMIEIPESFCNILDIKKATFQKAEIVHQEAFYYCQELIEINLPSVEYIEDCSFSSCTKLSEINFPSLIEIENNVFDDCDNLAIFKAENLKKIGNYNFNSVKIELILPSLETVGDYFLKDLSTTFDKLNIDKLKFIGNYGFENNCEFHNVTFKNLLYVGDNFLASSPKLEEVNIPSLLVIGKNAFKNCENLKIVNLPKLISVNSSGFKNCGNLIYLNLNECYTIMKNSFTDCHSLVSVDFPNLHDIFSNSFLNCTSLQNFSATNLKTIYSRSFENCNNLTFLNVPNLLMDGDSSLFKNKSENQQNYSNLIIIESTFFENEHITDISIKNVKYILKNSFKSCESVTDVFAEKAKYIGEYAFSGCINLLNLHLPKALYLSQSSFSNCLSIKKIDLRSVQKFVGDCIFENCSSLQILILSNLNEVNETSQNIFKNCNNLSRIDFGSNEPSTFNNYTFESTGIQKIYIDNVLGIPINLCLPYTKDYKNYGKEQALWKGIFNSQPNNYFQICTLSKEKNESHMIFLLKNVFIPIISVIFGVLIFLFVYKTIKRRKQNLENNRSLYISVIDDEEEDNLES